MHILKKRLTENLKILDKVNIEDYKNTEIIKNIPDIHSEEVIPVVVLFENSSPEEIFTKVLEFEKKLEEFYRQLRRVLVYSKSKELLDMLIQFKEGQIKEIKSLMDSYDLVM